MATKFGLDDATIKAIHNIFAKNALIERVIIYGSRALGNYLPGSDIDLTIIASNLAFSDLLEIDNKLDDLDLPYKFDLSLFHKIENAKLIDHINQFGAVFYSRVGA